MKTVITQLLSLLVIAGLQTPIFAQDLPRERERAGRAASRSQAAQDAAQASKDAMGKDVITYQQVFQNPDDISLNYRYARQQIARGDFKGASATLERILMVDPALPKVRLLYAVVLYRLDNLPEAQKELRALQKLEMPQALREEINDYLARIRQRMKSLRLSGSLGFGWQYDDNRSAGPATGRGLFSGSPVNLATGLRQSDTSLLFTGGIDFEYTPENPYGHTFIGSFNYFRQDQTLIDTLDLDAFSASFGMRIQHWSGTYTPCLLVDQILLSGQTYLMSRGGELRWDRRLNNTVGLYLVGRHYFHDFLTTDEIINGPDRTGNQTDVGAGATIALNPQQRLTVGFMHFDKDSRQRFLAYKRNELRVRHGWLLGKGRFLLTSWAFNEDNYQDFDRNIDPNRRRRDRINTVSSTLGIPMGLLWRPLKKLLWTLNYTWLQNESNMLNYSYTNNSINTMFTYRFDY